MHAYIHLLFFLFGCALWHVFSSEAFQCLRDVGSRSFDAATWSKADSLSLSLSQFLSLCLILLCALCALCALCVHVPFKELRRSCRAGHGGGRGARVREGDRAAPHAAPRCILCIFSLELEKLLSIRRGLSSLPFRELRPLSPPFLVFSSAFFLPLRGCCIREAISLMC